MEPFDGAPGKLRLQAVAGPLPFTASRRYRMDGAALPKDGRIPVTRSWSHAYPPTTSRDGLFVARGTE
jgi:hypothetical protein